LSLLLDENLSPKLTSRLASLFPGLIHVRDVGPKQAGDSEIWMWARETRYTIVTTDSDFVALATRHGAPPKLIHLERCDFPLRVIEEILRLNAIRISEFEADVDARLLILSRR
jgi:predicted nuclease of predicted toxin-antitoxin system